MQVTRRAFLGAAVAAASTPLAQIGSARPAADMRINPERLRKHLEVLSTFGRPRGGSFADGVSRVGFSDADVEGRRYAISLMKAAGLDPRIDPAGNIVARRDGSDSRLPPILIGSHIDSVPSGGNFDGDLGSLAAIEVAQILNERRLATRRPLEVVIWSNEEGVAYSQGLLGSRTAAGKLADSVLGREWNGVKLTDGLRKIGGDPDRLSQARRADGSLHCYLELHIEQGGTLDKAGIPVGVVEGIVSIARYDTVVRGFANHAGTTPMPDRQDALLAAARLALAVNEVVTSEPGRQVGTVGHFAVSPNATNVVPGMVRLSIELRDLSSAKIARLAEAIQARAREIARETRTEITITPSDQHEGAAASPRLQAAIEEAAARLGLRSRRLPSGAGHDAQMMALVGPMGMIFVPSVGGVSHAPKELTHWEDCARGADVLLHTVLALDAQAAAL